MSKTIFDQFKDKFAETGSIIENKRQVITISGLPGVKLEEILVTESGKLCFVFNIRPQALDAIPLDSDSFPIGTQISRTGLSLGVSRALLESANQTNDSLLNLNLDSLKADPQTWFPINPGPPGIENRQLITQSLETGITMIDSLIPIGQGQRQLFLGERNTGKSSIAVQVVLNQAAMGTRCIIAMIGRRHKEISDVQTIIESSPHKEKIHLVASQADEPNGRIFATPYTAMTLAEHYRDQGESVLVVLDDMTTHAKFYREISLISGRFPGKDSYPGDIFHIHARLLERAGNFKTDKGEAAISCLPVVTTASNNINDYIPTNLMSITDGHLFFDPELFFQGKRPAINPFLSVTRLGRQTLSELGQALSLTTIDNLIKHRQALEFARFGSDMAPGIAHDIKQGELIWALLQQQLNQRLSIAAQQFLLQLVTKLPDLDLVNLSSAKKKLSQMNSDQIEILSQQLAQPESIIEKLKV